MVELKGSLNGIGLSAIVQLIGELHHSGSLQLAKGNAHAVLGFDDGRLVLASYEHDAGLQALANCVRDLNDGEFRFVEGTVTGERTLNLAYTDLQQQLSSLASSAVTAPTRVPTVTPEPERERQPQPVTPEREQQAAPVAAEQELGTCPLLGFADDRTRHYSRPTALHRFFASGVAS